MAGPLLIRRERIERRVLRLRGQNVMLDEDLAALYGVDVKALNQAVKRNRERFPPDFMFRLTAQETTIFEVTNCDRKDRGAAAGERRPTPSPSRASRCCRASCAARWPSASTSRSCAPSSRSAACSSRIGDLADKLDELEEKYDEQFAVVFEAIRKLMTPPRSTRPRIGFRAW